MPPSIRMSVPARKPAAGFAIHFTGVAISSGRPNPAGIASTVASTGEPGARSSPDHLPSLVIPSNGREAKQARSSMTRDNAPLSPARLGSQGGGCDSRPKAP